MSFRAEWLIKNLGEIVMCEMQKEPLLGCSFSCLTEFSASFSASSKIDVCCSYIVHESFLKYMNIIKAGAPDMAFEKFKDLEDHMKGLIERHVESVPSTPGLREELRAEILNGMTATWHLVSPQFQHSW
jgi:hypothetical protein